MRVAVLSLTKNRLDYSRHCFASLREFAGCEFDHFVFDNGSTDGTWEWLQAERESGRIHRIYGEPNNIGIHRAMNRMLREIPHTTVYRNDADEEIHWEYDVVVKVDNDCELTVPGTLRAVAEVHLADPRSMVGPVVQGLRGPVPLGAARFVPAETEGEGFLADERVVNVYNVAVTPMIGGIMQPIPPGWRYNEQSPPWGGDDDALSAQAEWCGQLLDYPVNHYKTTDGQHEDYPDYFAERVAAGGPA